MNWWMPDSGVSDMDGIILDGSIRSGKTLPESVSYVDWGMATFANETFGMAGFTLGALRRNVLGPLKRTLPGRGYIVKDVRSSEEPHLEITKGDRTNRFYLFGGNNERSQDPVLGFTGAGFYFDQVELMPRSFVETAEGRCSVDGSKLWYNCNPKSYNHWFYQEYIQQNKDKHLLYLHFLMEDNLSLSKKTLERYERRWPKSSVFYRRNILGQWVAAEGRVFGFFDQDPAAGYVVSKLPDHFTQYLVGNDYGTANPFAYTLWGLSGGVWYIIREFYWDSVKEHKQKVNHEYIDDLANLCYWNNNPVPAKIIIPPEEAGFIREIKQSKYQHLSHVRAADNAIMPGLEDIATLFTTGKLKVYEKCEKTIWGFNDLLWDQKQQERGIDMYIKGGSGSPDHICDANRYAAREAAKTLRQMRLLS